MSRMIRTGYKNGSYNRKKLRARYGSFILGVVFGALLGGLTLSCIHIAGCFCGSGSLCAAVPWCGGWGSTEGPGGGDTVGVRGGLYVAVIASSSSSDADAEDSMERSKVLMDTWGKQASSVSIFVADTKLQHHHQQQQKQIPGLQFIDVKSECDFIILLVVLGFCNAIYQVFRN
eukprot:GHVU01159165.1.p1 GENE.GHVU01159165.1~~GHVU01159165.1.p1  ORF type:complete len:174 (+),score=7.04 GHVU01159165.1:507-1028(+)